MESKKTIRYTLRGVPPKVDNALRRKARQEGVSLNQMAIEAIARGLGFGGRELVYHDLDDLAGTRIEDPAFDNAMREMDRVDTDRWF
jgi:hypothetical protein